MSQIEVESNFQPTEEQYKSLLKDAEFLALDSKSQLGLELH